MHTCPQTCLGEHLHWLNGVMGVELGDRPPARAASPGGAAKAMTACNDLTLSQ